MVNIGKVINNKQIKDKDYGEYSLKFMLEDTASCQAFGSCLAQLIEPNWYLYLQGNLGVGKTTLSQGILKGLGAQGPVKSPSYALVETYELPGLQVAHIDLYRISDPEELEFMGIRDYFNKQFLCIVEWAEKAETLLPAPDLNIQLDIDPKRSNHSDNDSDETTCFRKGTLTAHSEQAKEKWNPIKKRLSEWTPN